MDAATLRSLVDYCPETGEFRWAVARPACRKGDLCGRVNRQGYREIGLLGRLHKANRLAFLYMAGRWPNGDVDHINRDKADDRWSNLREATRSQNAANTAVRTSNTSGFPGVVWDKDRERWRAQIRLDGRKKNLGRFDTFDEAKAAVQQAARQQWQEFASWAA